MVQIYWDSLKKRFLVVVPYQHVSGVEIRVPEEQPGQLDEERFYYYADVHSHNIMPAFSVSRITAMNWRPGSTS